MDEEIILGEIYVSPLVEAKIIGKHGLEFQDILDACTDPLGATWVSDPGRGLRLFVEGVTGTKKRICIILFPTPDPTIWRLGTAFPA